MPEGTKAFIPGRLNTDAHYGFWASLSLRPRNFWQKKLSRVAAQEQKDELGGL